jgi:hypothetical protein
LLLLLLLLLLPLPVLQDRSVYVSHVVYLSGKLAVQTARHTLSWRNSACSSVAVDVTA